ncbi:MAG: chemotaxis-specific protein-glutamate methyltransferase CheB [Phormidesmis sp.]
MNNKVNVAIANDTLIALEALRRAIATEPAYRLIWTARDGAEAIAKAKRHPPDLILMDLLMPKMDGVEATRQIMAHTPCAILLVTGSVRKNTSRVFEAMGHGALDVVQTPTITPIKGKTNTATAQAATQAAIQAAAKPLLAKMVTVSKFIGKYARVANHHPKSTQSAKHAPPSRSLIVIGASTGGPKALAKILSQLPRSLPAAVVIVQHIDPQFVPGLAEWLAGQSMLPVHIAKTGDVPKPGRVLLANAKGHLAMKRDRSFTYLAASDPAVADTVYRPSVDVLFKSVAQHWRSPGQAVLLTGMGKDGAAGLSVLQTAGWCTIAENQQSAVVYGMPRAAVEMGAANHILSSDEIAKTLTRLTLHS